MCSPEAAAAGGQVYGGALSANGQYQQGKIQEGYYNYLADQTSKQAGEIDSAAKENLSLNAVESARQIQQSREQSDQVGEIQKATMAANGVYSGSGTYGDILNDTADKQQLDEAAIKYNADLEAWKIKRESINQKSSVYAQEATYRLQAKNSRTASKIQALGTLVGSASGAGASMARAS